MTAIETIPSRAEALGVGDLTMLIGGEWGANGDDVAEQVHPAINRPVARFGVASAEVVDRAVRAARDAFDAGPWPVMPAHERAAVLRRFVALAEAAADEITQLQILDNSMPIQHTGRSYLVSGEVVSDVFNHHIGWIDKLGGETYPAYRDANAFAMTVREPIGVVGVILPWNSPVFLFCQKAAPALAAGCALVVKPSEHASIAVRRVVELLHQAGLPPGVVNLVTGPADPTGLALVDHPGVDMVTFTGGVDAGRRIHASASGSLKRVSLELGGKSPFLVFADADPKASGMLAMAGVAMGMSGQSCATPTRVLVERSLYDDVLVAASAAASTVVLGDPFDAATTSAPMISPAHLERVQARIDAARGYADIVIGGTPATCDGAPGNWMSPTLVANADPKHAIVQEEIFGPVLVAVPFDTEAEAIELANNTGYGLAARIATNDGARAMRVARALRSGTVGINGYMTAPNIPFGGVKLSGNAREGGREGILEFTQLKTIVNFVG